MKRVKFLLKIIVAALTAAVILSAFCSVYYCIPVHIDNPDHNTDYIWPSGSTWSIMTEGFAHGTMDSNGYNNLQAIENPDILFLGSSHIEAMNVPQAKSAPSVLQQLLGKQYTVYNMGISGHNFAKVCQYLPETMHVFDIAPKYIIIETSSVWVDQDMVSSVIEHLVPAKQSHAGGFLGMLQKIPFVRLAYKQLYRGLAAQFLTGSPAPAEEETQRPPVDADAYEQLFSYLETVSGQTKLIIMYHPTAVLQKDGTALIEPAPGLTAFAQGCRAHNILFADMTVPFQQMYDTEYRLPHGFITGKIAFGHLNADGHALIAKELHRIITEEEEAAQR